MFLNDLLYRKTNVLLRDDSRPVFQQKFHKNIRAVSIFQRFILLRLYSKYDVLINLFALTKGVGVGQLIATICIISYYSTLIAMTLFYMCVSFSSELPWSRCWESWGADCVDSMPNQKSWSDNITRANTSQASSSSELYFL